MMSHPSLVLLLGVSGSGKTTVMNYLIQQFPILQYVTSTTTRDPRPGEVDGERYHFVSQESFQASIDAGEFLEYATVHGQNRYGTKRADIQQILEQGQVPIKEVDIA
jgi:guanylate kinase